MYINVVYFIELLAFALIPAFFDALTFCCRKMITFYRYEDDCICYCCDFSRITNFWQTCFDQQLDGAVTHHKHHDACCYTETFHNPFVSCMFIPIFPSKRTLSHPCLKPIFHFLILHDFMYAYFSESYTLFSVHFCLLFPFQFTLLNKTVQFPFHDYIPSFSSPC